MREHIDSAYKILSKVFQDGTYSNMALAGERVSDMSTRLVYGTLEEHVKIDSRFKHCCTCLYNRLS